MIPQIKSDEVGLPPGVYKIKEVLKLLQPSLYTDRSGQNGNQSSI